VERSPSHKLTLQEVIEIKQLLKQKCISQIEISKIYNICTTTISDIKRGRSRKHINV